MNRQEAEQIANEVASRYRAHPRDELLRLLKEQDTFELVAPTGTRYQLEVEAVWDDRKGNNLRVFVAIDDGGPSTFKPLVVDFIIAPDGRFVGETWCRGKQDEARLVVRRLLACVEPRRQLLGSEIHVTEVNALKDGLTEVVTHEFRFTAPDSGGGVTPSHLALEDDAAYTPDETAVHEFCWCGEDRRYDRWAKHVIKDALIETAVTSPVERGV